MSKILSNRDYHLAKFRIGKYIERGIDMLTSEESQELNDLITDMRAYERVNFSFPEYTTFNGLLNEYLEKQIKEG